MLLHAVETDHSGETRQESLLPRPTEMCTASSQAPFNAMSVIHKVFLNTLLCDFSQNHWPFLQFPRYVFALRFLKVFSNENLQDMHKRNHHGIQHLFPLNFYTLLSSEFLHFISSEFLQVAFMLVTFFSIKRTRTFKVWPTELWTAKGFQGPKDFSLALAQKNWKLATAELKKINKTRKDKQNLARRRYSLIDYLSYWLLSILNFVWRRQPFSTKVEVVILWCHSNPMYF